jgi:biopolymer transport protein ExbB
MQGVMEEGFRPGDMGSLFDLVLAGGPVMVPIGLASVVALGYAVERWIRLRPRQLGLGDAFSKRVLGAVQSGGAAGGLAACGGDGTPMARILAAGLARARAPFVEREKAVEDVALREVRGLTANLRPIYLVYLIAPLLGLLGTVWGMILAFANIAAYRGLGKPELLAEGIYQALVTTAAGLVIAIPALVAHHHLKGRVERFARGAEELYAQLERALGDAGAACAEASRAHP